MCAPWATEKSRPRSRLVEQPTILRLNLRSGVDKLIHGAGSTDGWSLRQESGGLLIDLGAVYKIDVLQIWNFAAAGLEAYGPAHFDLWVSSDAAPPADTSLMTPVLDDEPLARAASGDLNYFGETYLFSGATATVIPDELADENGGPSDRSSLAVVGRYLFLGDLQGLPGVGHVGLSEVRVYGRPVTAPDLVFVQGDGRGGERTLSFQGLVGRPQCSPERADHLPGRPTLQFRRSQRSQLVPVPHIRSSAVP